MAEGFDSIQSLLQQVHAGAQEPTGAKKDDSEEREKERRRYEAALGEFTRTATQRRDVQKRLAKFRREGIYAIRPWQWGVLAVGVPLLLFFLGYFIRTFSNVTQANLAANRGLTLVYAGNTEEGLQQMERALSYGADTIEIKYQFGRALHEMEHYRTALNLLTDAVALARSRDATKMTTASIAAAEVHLDLGELTDAEKFARGILEEDPKQREALIISGKVHLLQSKYERAREAFIGALERNPASLTPRYYLRELYLQQNRLSDALEQEEYLLLARPSGDEDFQTLTGYANLLQRERRLREAEEILQSVLQSTRKPLPEIMVSLGHLAIEMQDLQKAEQYADSAVLVAPSYPHGYVLRGEIAYENGDKNAAFLDFRKALELDPLHPKAAYDMGCFLLYDLDEPAQALRYFTTASENGFVGPFLWYNIGVSEYLTGDPASALAAYGRTPRFLGNSPQYQWSYAGAALLGRQVDTALAIYLKLRESQERNPALENNIGVSFELQGDTIAAMKRYWSAIRMAKTPEQSDTLARANIERVLLGSTVANPWDAMHTQVQKRLTDVSLPQVRP